MRVLILGGGYAGLHLAKRLLRGPAAVRLDLLLVDRAPFHTLKTQLHRLAAGSAGPAAVTMRFPHQVYLVFRQGTVTRLYPAGCGADVGQGELRGDVLVVALGSEAQTFGVPGVHEHALTLEGFPEALAARERIATLPRSSRLLIVGAGLTGVELAAEVRETRPDLAVTVVEAAPSPVPAFPEHIREYVAETLGAIGCDLRCGEGVRAVRLGEVDLASGDRLAADATVWAAGVRPRAVVREAGFQVGQGQRVVVDAAGQAQGFPGVYVVGDAALAPLPPSAQLAQRQATVAAGAIEALSLGVPYRPRPLRLSGMAASLGTRQGFSTLLRREVVGPPARQLKTLTEWLYHWYARR